MAKRLESLSAAAKYANVNPRTLRRYIASGRLTAYRVGPKLIKIDLNELEASFEPVAVVPHESTKKAPPARGALP